MAINVSNPKFQRAMLIVLFVAAACYGYWMYIFQPRREKVTLVETELNGVTSNVNTARSLVQAADTVLLVEELAKRERELKMAEELLPEKENLPGLLDEVTRMGQANGIEFALFEPKTPIQYEQYQERPYALTIRGGYHQTARFLSEVASLTQIVKPTKLSLVRDKRETPTEGETLTADLTLSTYLLIKGPPTPPPAAKGKKK